MSFKVGDKEIKPGEKVKGFIKVGEASTHDINIPYVIINGSKPGPILCVLSGVHPLEYASLRGVLRLVKEVEPGKLKGILVVVPVVNMEGFNARAVFNNPIDYVNQNRVFPGDPTGTMSRRVAAALFENFVSKAEALIDSHGGDLTEDIYRFVIVGNTEKKDVYQKMLDMAACCDSLYTKSTDIVGGTGVALKMYGIPTITPESGTPYPVRLEEIEFHHNGIINVMKYMGMLEGQPEMKKNLKVNPKSVRFCAERGGLWLQMVRAGQRVKKGEELGVVVNLFGDTLQTVVAPYDGIANNSRTSNAVNSGDTLLSVIDV